MTTDNDTRNNVKRDHSGRPSGINGIVTRPGASDGLWLCALLPACYIISVWIYGKRGTTVDYRRTTVATFGLLLHSISRFARLKHPPGWISPMRQLLMTGTVLCGCGFMFWSVLKENLVFSFTSSLLIVAMYEIMLRYILRSLPRSFTLGEASVIAQGIGIFLYNCFLQLPASFYDERPVSETQALNLVLQIGLLGVIFLIMLTHLIPVFRRSVPFWMLLVTVVIAVASAPVAQQPAIVVLLRFLYGDDSLQHATFIGGYLVLLFVTISFVVWQLNRGQQATTVTRKAFHLLMVMVYIPGLWFKCHTLYVSSVLLLAVLIVLEIARVIRLAPVAGALDQAVHMFLDEKDSGAVALTPIYLLVGCSLPMWLHCAPCDITDSAGLNYLVLSAGTLSIGIGDTMASVCGYHFGRHKWTSYSNRSVEGTVASVLWQMLFLFVSFRIGMVQFTISRFAYGGIAIIVNALLEARTDQIDNLVLPLVTFCVLSFS